MKWDVPLDAGLPGADFGLCATDAASGEGAQMANPYQILRIPPGATPEQIDEAYHRMRKSIPDERRAREDAIRTAYAILSDPERRSRIDEALKRRRQQARPPRPRTAAMTAQASREARPGDSSLLAGLQKLLPFRRGA